MPTRTGSRDRLLPAAAMLLAIACDSTPPAVPAKLAFTVQPASASAGALMSPAVAVVVQDAEGNTISNATNSITLAVNDNAGGGALSGTTTVAAVHGVAIFSNLRLDQPGTGYTLSATSPNLTGATSTPFAVAAGPASKLVFTVQPALTTAAATIMPAVAVAVQDAFGNPVTTATHTVLMAIGNPAGSGTLGGTTSVAAVNGVATFSNLSINGAGTGYTLVAAVPNLSSAISIPFTVAAGPASKLVFTVQPAATVAGVTILPAAAVAIQDLFGNTVTTATNSVTVSIGSNAGSGTLTGTTTVAAVSGVATFNDLSIDNAGAGYTLTAAAANLSGSTSVAFSIRVPLVFTTIAPGYFHSCGIVTGGIAYCWGSNGSGQLGVNTGFQSSAPVAVSGGFSFATLSAGRDHNCGLTTGGLVHCWGTNFVGELGNGTTANSSTPVAVAGGLSFATVSAGYSHTCGVTTGGAGYCWGSNGSGELGTALPVQSNAPALVLGGLTFAGISPGRNFTCGLTTAGVAYCWGINSDGELGDGTQTLRTSPTAVSGQLTFARVTAGGFHACGLTTGGLAYCWGANFAGELGNGTTNSSSVPVAVSGGLIFASLSAGNRHTCGVTPGGLAYCWGENAGMLGNGITSNSSTPVAVAGGRTFGAISAGRFHSCGVTASGAGYCWGNNGDGKLGDGSTVSSLVPVLVHGSRP